MIFPGRSAWRPAGGRIGAQRVEVRWQGVELGVGGEPEFL
jgi:hypothetical protein